MKTINEKHGKKNGFTLAEVKDMFPRPFGERVRVRGYKKGFTLAEVLITLGVIGVVAALTLPSFMLNVTQRINSERQANIAQKVTQAMEHMRVHGLLNTQYPTTEAFVDELQKYLKITKRCDSEHVAECWPTSTVTMSDGEELEVSKAKTGKNLSLSTDTNNVGLILADGASIILNYNPAKNPIDVGDRVEATHKSLPVGNGKEKEFIYTTDVTDGVDFVMDVNGGKKPNSEVNGKTRDIRSFKSASFTEVDPCKKYANSFEVEGVGCVVNAGSYKWADAKAKCASLNNMHLTDQNELNTVFKRNCHTNGKPLDYNADTCISDIPKTGKFWSSVTEIGNNNRAWGKDFGNGYETTYNKSGNYNVLCVGN